MKYGIAIPADQTITYVVNADGEETVSPKKAKLWDTKFEAKLSACKLDWLLIDLVRNNRSNDPTLSNYVNLTYYRGYHMVFEVADEVIFRNGPDTW